MAPAASRGPHEWEAEGGRPRDGQTLRCGGGDGRGGGRGRPRPAGGRSQVSPEASGRNWPCSGLRSARCDLSQTPDLQQRQGTRVCCGKPPVCGRSLGSLCHARAQCFRSPPRQTRSPLRGSRARIPPRPPQRGAKGGPIANAGTGTHGLPPGASCWLLSPLLGGAAPTLPWRRALGGPSDFQGAGDGLPPRPWAQAPPCGGPAWVPD